MGTSRREGFTLHAVPPGVTYSMSFHPQTAAGCAAVMTLNPLVYDVQSTDTIEWARGFHPDDTKMFHDVVVIHKPAEMTKDEFVAMIEKHSLRPEKLADAR